MKVVNYKKNDKDFKLAWCSIRNKLFGTTKEFKAFKILQNSEIEFTKNNKYLKNKRFEDPWFD